VYGRERTILCCALISAELSKVRSLAPFQCNPSFSAVSRASETAKRPHLWYIKVVVCYL